jgi:hypothetical protein
MITKKGYNEKTTIMLPSFICRLLRDYGDKNQIWKLLPEKWRRWWKSYAEEMGVDIARECTIKDVTAEQKQSERNAQGPIDGSLGCFQRFLGETRDDIICKMSMGMCGIHSLNKACCI